MSQRHVKLLRCLVVGIRGVAEKMIAGRWIAGEGIDDALEVSKKLNARNVSSILNYLGENLKSSEKISEACDKYLLLISDISKTGIKASIAVKPTQLGLALGYKAASANYGKIVAAARRKKVFVWMDMEESRYTDSSIKMYLEKAKGKNTGICIQSYLRRSKDDTEKLMCHGAIIRLVKGAYSESPEAAFPQRESATRNFSEIMDLLFRKSERFMVATHDRRLISQATNLSRKSKAHVSFGMLNGIMNNYAYALAKTQDVHLYLPFGEEWISYGYRRMKELRNSVLIAKSLFSK